MSYSFKQQLRQGSLGEAIFFEAHCKQLQKLDGLEGDFLHKETGDKWELKTDMWPMEKTQNFFFERFSNFEKKTAGGPWQALEHGCKTFVYFFVSNMTYFKFQCEPLVALLEDVVAELPATEVKNTTHTTVGFRVPRDAVMGIAEEVKLKISLPKERKKND